ncbi:extracellular with a signal peptide [Cryptosporidium sp. chipmunk genotype I]|uniref:extracellular with a signal peptide n=1 Tax=Cryptosporidium sp. chipmunk genotype I TaxID=1280935 RepID=UPI00351A9ED3|nr:extracellular with a signal peptide [Cryptosporidium sp. chipmunk genotype I]
MVFKILKYILTILIFIIFEAESDLQNNVENNDLITINTYLRNKISVFELIKFENQRFMPKNVSVEFYWDKFQVNDVNKRVCYFYKLKNDEESSENQPENEYSCSITGLNLFQVAFSREPISLKENDIRMLEISKALLRFFDYEYDPSRPSDDSNTNINIWRNFHYNKMKLNNLIVPGKGSSRVYIKTEIDLAFIGNYFGYLKVKFDDEVELKAVKLSIGPSPLNIFILKEEQVFEESDDRLIIFDFMLRNNLIFRNLNIFVQPKLESLDENLCQLGNISIRGSPKMEIGPVNLEKIQIICSMRGLKPELIKDLLSIQISSFWGSSSRYKTTYKYIEMIRYERKLNRGLFLPELTLDYPIFQEFYNFNIIQHQEYSINYLKESETGIINFVNPFRTDFLSSQHWITLDLLQISEEVFNLRNIKIIIKIDSELSDSLHVTFDNNNSEKSYELDLVNQMNSLLFLKINVKFNPKTLIDQIFVSKKKLQIPIKVKLFEKEKNVYNKANDLERIWIFNFDLESGSDEYIIRDNILENKNGQSRLIVSDLDENITLNILKINNSKRNKSKEIEVNLLENKENSFILVSRISVLKMKNYDVGKLILNLKGLIDTKILELKQKNSAINNSIEDLPYFIEVGKNKRLQLATLANCGIVELNKNQVDFGIVPVSLFGNPKLIQKIEMKLRRFGAQRKCNKKVSVGFSISSNFKLRVEWEKSQHPSSSIRNINIKRQDEELVKEYIYDFHIEDSEVFLLVIEPDFNSPINVEHKQTTNISTQLEVYAPVTMRKYPKHKLTDTWKKFNLNNKFFSRNLFFNQSIKITCIIRSLHVSAGTPQIRSALHSEIMSQELVKSGKLPISLFFIEIKNEEDFPVQYSLQRDSRLGNKQGEKNNKYFTENYTFYVSYEKNTNYRSEKSINDFEEHFSILENKSFSELINEGTELFDNLSFNFPVKSLYFMNVVMLIKLGMVCVYDGEVFTNQSSFCVKLLPVEIAERIGNLKVSMGHLRINIWQIVIRFCLDNKNFDFLTGLKFYETGRIDWYFYNLGTSFEFDLGVFEKFIPIIVSNLDLESAFELKETIELGRIGKIVRISTVPWLEVSNEIPRTGYLLPKENRLISILVHNQIVTSTSINSKFKELKCSYNLVFKGLTDIGGTLDGSDDPFSRMLLESDHELRQENTGMKSLFPLEWTIPNVVNELGYGGGFVKKISLVNSPTSRIGGNFSVVEYIQFVVEIQNPIFCTKRERKNYTNENGSDPLNIDLDDQQVEEFDSDEANTSKDKFCIPFNNREIVKGFRVIWYPYNNFSPTNYKSVEILIEDVPKFNFKTSSYSFESDKQKESEENFEVSRIFTDYIKEAGSEDSDFAYLLKINYDFVLNQQYTFKFAITHHENIRNSVFVPPFGFNVTAQNHSLRWLRSLNSIENNISKSSILKNFTKIICKGDVNIFSDNSMVLKWDKEFLKIISTFSISYLEVDTIQEVEEEWQVKELLSELIIEEREHFSNDKNLLFIRNSHKTEDGISKFFSEDVNNGTRVFIRIPVLPSSLKIKILVEMEDYNSEKFQCISKTFQTNEGVPNEPKDFQFIPMTINSLKLSWDIPKSNGGSEILDYLINLSPELVTSPNEYKIENITIISDNLMIILDQIYPLVTYKATVQARNKFGLGKPSIIRHISSRGLNTCLNTGNYKLVINENSRRQISWKVENLEKINLRSVLIYLYCNKRSVLKSQYFLIELLKASNLCNLDNGQAFCTWIENEEYILNSRCDSYSIKMINKIDKFGSEDFSCISELGTQRFRKLKGESNNNMNLNHLIKVNHISSMDELTSIKEKEKLYYPRGYNPNWDNGLTKTILKMDLMNQNTSLIEIKVNYLHETESMDEIILNGTLGNVFYNKYYYDLKQEKEIRNSGSMKNWDIFAEKSNLAIKSHKLGQTEQIELMVLNLIPEMTVMISVRELDGNNTEISASRHVLRIPNKTKKIELSNRRLLNLGILKAQLDDYFITQGELSDKNNGMVSNLRNLNDKEKVSENQLTLRMNTDLDSIGTDLSNSLFISSKMVIDGWPEDFERRLFNKFEIAIYSGYLRFKNNSREISGSVDNYKPISELQNESKEKPKEGIQNLFDGDFETGINFYNNNFTGGVTLGIDNVIYEEHFPHISLKFDPPICILYAKLYWGGNKSPVSTMLSVGLRSRNVSRPRIRSYNPIVHDCFENTKFENESYTQERIDTIQIIPPEEMVNTYFTNPSNRYPYIYNFTLSFAGFCGGSRLKQTRDEVVLSLREIEIVPCISNDLALSYSDPLSETSISLVNPQHLLKKSQLEEKYSEIQKIILDNLRKDAEKNTGDLDLRNISIKYKKPINETKIYLDLNTVLSEESKLRSIHIPSVRLLIQESSKDIKSTRSNRNHRRLSENDTKTNSSLLFGYNLHLWLNLTVIWVWNLIYLLKRLN